MQCSAVQCRAFCDKTTLIPPVHQPRVTRLHDLRHPHCTCNVNCNINDALHTSRCTSNTAQCIMHNAHCTRPTAHCILHTSQFTLYIAHCAFCTLYSSTSHNIQFYYTLCTLLLHTTQSCWLQLCMNPKGWYAYWGGLQGLLKLGFHGYETLSGWGSERVFLDIIFNP